MKTYLIRFTTKGIKNLDKLTSVDFYNNSITKGKTIDLEKKNLKGIFGINGAGKSAYVLALDIYNSITTKNDYLVQNIIRTKLDKLINKATKELLMECIFAVSKEDDETKVDEIFKHTIIVSPKYEYGQTELKLEEKLEKLIGTTINTDYSLVYEVNDGKLLVNDNLVDKEWFINEYSNRLEKSSLASYMKNSLDKQDVTGEDVNKKQLLWFVSWVFINSFTTKVFIDMDDLYDNVKLNDTFITKYTKIVKNYTVSFNITEDIIAMDKLSDYEKQVEKLKEFIQILKPNLIDIRIDKKIDGDYYHCNKILVYENYEVDEEYESSGIKRIIKMYNYLNLAIKGYKVFIDELDANISGVFLDKLLEFYAENGKGQLCFTSHNIMSMNILKQYKNSITVFGETGKVVNVVKNGHYQPVNLFYEGFIEDCPFNINSFDFYKTFGLEETD